MTDEYYAEYTAQQIAAAARHEFVRMLQGLLFWALLIYVIVCFGGQVWTCVDEITPCQYAQVAGMDNEWTHAYIQECLSDDLITVYEFNRIYHLQSEGWKHHLKDKD